LTQHFELVVCAQCGKLGSHPGPKNLDGFDNRVVSNFHLF
jgi:hypothetical protein